MTKFKPTKKSDKSKSNNKGKNSGDCPCKLYLDGTAVQCEKCSMWWHTCCANLKNISKEGQDSLEDWLCPQCYVSPYVKRDFSPENCSSIVEMMKNELVGVIPTISAGVVNDLEKVKMVGVPPDIQLVKDAVAESMTEKMEEQSRKLESVVKKATKKDETKWSALFKTNSDKMSAEATKTVELSVTEAVNKNQGALLKKAVNNSTAIQENNQLERDRRKRNITIRNVPESNKLKLSDKIDDDREFVENLLEIIAVQPREIERVVRAGTAKKNEPRIVIATMATPTLAEDLHKYKMGRKLVVNGENGKKDKEFWINADLIQADRTADYNARQAKRDKEDERRKNEQERKDRLKNLASKAATITPAVFTDNDGLPPLVHRSALTTPNTVSPKKTVTEQISEIVPDEAATSSEDPDPFL